MKLSITSLTSLFSTALILLTSCGGETNSKRSDVDVYRPDFSSIQGVTNHLTHKSWSIWDGKLNFYKNGTCNFKRLNRRTNQLDYNVNGKYTVGKSKFDDTGAPYWYVNAEWETPGLINNFYTIYRSHLVEQSRQWLYFDNYGPVLQAWRSEGGLVQDRCKAY